MTLKPVLRSQDEIYSELKKLAEVRKKNSGLEGTQLDYCTKYRMEALMWALRLVKTKTIVPSKGQQAYMQALL